MSINNEEVKFTTEQENKLREYLNEDWFKELNSKVNMYDEESSNEKQIEHIYKYILHYCMSYNDDTEEAIENFFDLLNHYKTKTYRAPIRDDNGLIRLNKSGFNSGNAFYTGKIKSVKTGSGNGTYIDGLYISTDRKEYIKKLSMDAKGQMQDYNYHEQSRYNGVIAHELFKYFGEESAKYLPSIKTPPYYYVLSENFLNKNQELISFTDLYNIAPGFVRKQFSDVIKMLENNLRLRYLNKIQEDKFINLIEKLKLQYAKQEFIKRIINLKDENLGNTALVLTTSGMENELPTIDISPAYDLDLSFNLSEESKMVQLQTDNGQTDIKSVIQEFTYIKGFREFIESVVDKIQDEDSAIESIINNSYQTSKAKFFVDEDNRRDYTDFLKVKFRETKQAYNEIYIKSDRKGEDEDVRAILD